MCIFATSGCNVSCCVRTTFARSKDDASIVQKRPTLEDRVSRKLKSCRQQFCLWSPFYRREERAKEVRSRVTVERPKIREGNKKGIREGTWWTAGIRCGSSAGMHEVGSRCWEEVFVSKIIVQGRVSGLDGSFLPGQTVAK